VIEPEQESERAAGPALNLLGSHAFSLDDKRRVAVPKTFRAQITDAGLEETYVLCRQLGGDPCLALFPQERFEAALGRLEAMRDNGLGIGNKRVRAYLRKLRRSAAVLKPDKQGRVTLTEAQCQLAGIGKEGVWVGSGDHIELWSPERLDVDDDDKDFGALAHDLFG